MGRLGADDPSVRYGFETGECLALPAGLRPSDVSSEGSLWRFRVFGGRPYLYAADWAAGFRPTSRPIPQGFERFLPLTERLLANGRYYARCYDDYRQLNFRFKDHDRRWREYLAWGGHRERNAPVTTVYLGDYGPRLIAEYYDLRRQATDVDHRCRAIASIEVDDDFIDLVRTSRG